MRILQFDSANASLDNAGGKGANLVHMTRAGFPVPGGFIIATQAYRDFVNANALSEKIATILNTLQADNPDALEAASTTIRNLFAKGTMPAELAREIVSSYLVISSEARNLSPNQRDFLVVPLPRNDSIPVAVRSSATAEDLPELSFAGQQDTYLNIIGEENLLHAVVNCWSSLWTARAIGYRARNNIPQNETALAVIVQAMVQSEASGVMFTANPLTGLRTQIVIDATLGLGEVLVSGQVEPDNYIVDISSKSIIEKTLGAKAIAIRSKADGGTVTQDQNAAQKQALPDAQILELAELGRRVAEEYKFPQDIEWAWANGKLYLLQSRAITSLYPLPEGVTPEDLRVMFSFGAVQGMLDPLTPLGRDVFRVAFSGGAALFGSHVSYLEQRVAHIAGERLWIDFTAVARSPIGHRILPALFNYLEAGGRGALIELLNDPRLQPGEHHAKLSILFSIAQFVLPVIAQIFRNWLNPDHRPEEILTTTDRGIAELQARSESITGTREEKLQQRVQLFANLARTFPDHLLPIAFGLASGMAAFNILVQNAKHATGSDQLALAIVRGVPHNVTTEMDLALWQTAKTIRADDASQRELSNRPAQDLARDYRAGKLPIIAQNAAAKFLRRYGMRGIAEIDLGRARWNEDPTPVFQSLASYLKIENEAMAPDVVIASSARRAEEAAKELEAAVRKTHLGALKARIVRFAVRRTRAFIGLREAPKFHAIRRMGIIRSALLASGKDFVDTGMLNQADDVFFLSFEELQAFAGGESRDWKRIVANHRAVFAREKMRRQIPRLLLSDGRAIYEGMSDANMASGSLRGSPVSPGVVEGNAHIVFDPHNAQLVPGEILVCPGTDPAWTPLFLSAGGLVMEVGGLMTHGAVVAREYGIPAVVGVNRATTRLQTGQKIRVNGTTGVIELL
ncbi:MAG: phosphoenolpyruvate synthase [Chloroflexi bacterium]|nr:phosphoenolpyruvate synthase [Chloroflexota bacterium]